MLPKREFLVLDSFDRANLFTFTEAECYGKDINYSMREVYMSFEWAYDGEVLQLGLF